MNTDLLAMEPLLLDTFTVIILQFTVKKLQDIEPSSSNNKFLLYLLYFQVYLSLHNLSNNSVRWVILLYSQESSALTITFKQNQQLFCCASIWHHAAETLQEVHGHFLMIFL